MTATESRQPSNPIPALAPDHLLPVPMASTDPPRLRLVGSARDPQPRSRGIRPPEVYRSTSEEAHRSSTGFRYGFAPLLEFPDWTGQKSGRGAGPRGSPLHLLPDDQHLPNLVQRKRPSHYHVAPTVHHNRSLSQPLSSHPNPQPTNRSLTDEFPFWAAPRASISSRPVRHRWPSHCSHLL